MESLECPVCGEEIHLKSSPRKNDTLICPLCDEKLWVVSKSPLRLQRVINKWDEEEDDWEWESRRSSKSSHNGKGYSDDLDYAGSQSRQGKNGRNKN